MATAPGRVETEQAAPVVTRAATARPSLPAALVRPDRPRLFMVVAVVERRVVLARATAEAQHPAAKETLGPRAAAQPELAKAPVALAAPGRILMHPTALAVAVVEATRRRKAAALVAFTALVVAVAEQAARQT
jgi:hypothetical protein